MIKNYLIIAFRNIQRSKGYAFINIAGLGIGMAASILILIWVHFETSIDRNYEHSDRIFAVWRNSEMQGEIFTWDYTPAPYAPALKSQFPEVEEVSRITEWGSYLLTVGENNFYEETTFADPGFFKIFNFETLEGDPIAALEEAESIILTERVARNLFGEESAIGKTVKLEKQLDLEVKAVIKDLPANTSFSISAFVPFKKLEQMGWTDESWGNNSYRTFALLSEGSAVEDFNQKFKGFTAKNSKDQSISDFLFPFEDLHLYGKFENGKSVGGKIELIRMFGAVSIIVLLIAGINFVNLSTAQSDRRAKEVGIRKLSGAGKKMLMGQFLAESTLIAFAAFWFALVLVSLAFPWFKGLIGQELENPLSQPFFWSLSALYVLLIGVLAGSYPAFLMSSFQPTKALKSQLNNNQRFGIRPREVLVVFQFAVVVVLISSVWIIRDQVRFVQNRDLGINPDNLIFHPMTQEIRKNKVALRNELLTIPGVSSVSYTLSPLTDIHSDTNEMKWQGKDPDFKPGISRMGMDANLVQTAGLELLQGRDIDIYTYPNDSLSAIINERTAEIMGFEDPIGQVIQDDSFQFTVVGVVKDFIMESPFEEVKPIVVTGPKRNLNFIHIRFEGGENLKSVLDQVALVFAKFNPDSPFEYRFVEEEHARKFKSQEQTASLTTVFTGIAVLISCMGLFGLATFMAERRKKEISVRKVMGASLTGIVTLITSEFTKLVILSTLIGIPVTWYFMSDWLKTFDYHTDLDWFIFIWTAGMTLLIALLTVSFQAIKAALVNPAKTLKSE